MRKQRNQKQDEIFLNFMSAHPNIAKGFYKGDKIEQDHLWSQLRNELNAAGPPIKDVATWKKVWIDWKANVKKKLSHNQTEVRSTGGGRFNQYVLTAADQEIATLCGLHTCVNGLDDSVNFGLTENLIIVDTILSPASPSNSTTHSLTPQSPKPGPSKKRKPDCTLEKLMEKENNQLKDISVQLGKIANYKQVLVEVVQNIDNKLEQLEKNYNEIVKIKKEKLEEIKKNRQEVKRHNREVKKHYTEMRSHNVSMQKLRAQQIELQLKTIELEEQKLTAKQ